MVKVKYLLPIFVFLFLISFNSSFAWWDNNYVYRKAINITSSESANYYQLRLNVTYDSGMQSDFDDIRFVYKDDSTELKYFLQDKVDNQWAVFWVLTNISSGTETNMYMYYGNPSVSTTSNVDETFRGDVVLFYPFDGDLEDKVSGYDLTATTPVYVDGRIGKAINISSSDNVAYYDYVANDIIDNLSATNGFTFVYYMNVRSTSDIQVFTSISTDTSGKRKYFQYYSTYGGWRFGLYESNGNVKSYSTGSVSLNSFHKWVLTINSSLYCSSKDGNNYVCDNFDGTLYNVDKEYLTIGANKYGTVTADVSKCAIDTLIIYNESIPNSIATTYLSSEPSVSYGSKESNIRYYTIKNNEYNSSVNELTYQDFGLIVNTTSNISSINASLYWNGTNYGYDNYLNNSGTYIFNKTLLIPMIEFEDDYAFYWNITVNYTNGTIIYDTTSANGTQEVNFSYIVTEPKIYEALTGNELNKTASGYYFTVEGKYFTFEYYVINLTNTIYLDNYSIEAINVTSFTAASGTSVYNLTPTCSRVNSTYEKCVVNKSMLGPYLNITAKIMVNETPRNNTSNLIISNLDPLSCSSGSKVYDIKFYDEQDRTAINQNGSLTFNVLWEENYTMLKYLNCSFDNVDTISVYTSSGGLGSYVNFTSSLYLEYYNNEYEKRNYYERDYTTRENSGEVKNIYNIKDTEGDGVLIRVKDQEGNGISQAQVIIKRWYPSTSSYNQVVSVQTDENGEVYTYLEWYTAYYKFQILINGTEVYESEVGTQITESPKEINIILNPQVPYTTWKSSVSYSVEWVGDILRISIYDSSNSFQKAYLNASKYTLTGWESVCNSSGDSPSTTLLCDLSDETGQVDIISYLQYSNGQYVIYKELKQLGSAVAQETKNEGTFYSLIFVILLALVGYLIAGVSGMLIMPILSIIGLNLLGVISITTSTIIGLFIAIIFAIIVIYKR